MAERDARTATAPLSSEWSIPYTFPSRAFALSVLIVLIAIFLIVPGTIRPRLLEQPYRAWTLLGHVLGWVNSRVVLGFLFFFVFTPVSVVMRLSGRDAMRRASDRNTDTYRIRKAFRPASHLKHQF